MKRSLLSLTILFGCLTAGGVAFAAEAGQAAETGTQAGTELEIEVESLTPSSEIIHYYEKGIAVGTNGVVIRYGSAVLVADGVTLDRNSGEAVATGNVTLEQDGQLWRGDRLRYNFRTRELGSGAFRTGAGALFASGAGLGSDPAARTYTATNAFVTTDDVADPAFRIRAERLTIEPGESVEARNAKVYVGSVPIFYFPYFRRSLDAYANRIVLTPGYRTVYGPYVLGSYNWFFRTNISGALNLDYRWKRGLGFGPDLHYELERWGTGDFSLYYADDQDPGEDQNGLPIRSDRYRVSFAHQAPLWENFTATIAVNKQSDRAIVRDFFESEYRDNPQPKSFLELNQRWNNYSLDLLARPQLNDFFQTVERLPDVKLSAFRQQLGVSPFYYEGESSAGYFRFRRAESVPGIDYDAVRLDTFHQIVVPWTFFGWLNVTPRIGGRLTHYGETDSEGLVLDEENRFVFNTGAEASFKASRIWPGARSRLLDITGIRHIVQPSVNYVFVPRPNVRPRELPQFDSEIRSLRLLPIHFPDYNSIDSIDSQNVIRLGLRNKIQTKRRDGIVNVLNWALYTDWRLDPRDGQSTFADLYSDLDIQPRSWLVISSETRTDLDEGFLRLANHTVTIAPGDIWSASLGHRYFREDPLYGPESANNLFFSSVYYKLNENWALRMTHHYEARDGTLEEQYYTIYRDLRSWTAALTFRFREHRFGPDDFTVAVTFSLKSFPRFKLGDDRDEHSLLLGG